MAIKKVNYKEEATIKEKEIKKTILKRYQNFENNQKRIINSLTNQRKNKFILDLWIYSTMAIFYRSPGKSQGFKPTWLQN